MRWKYLIGSLKYLTDIKHGSDLHTQFREQKFPEKSQNKLVVKHLPLIWVRLEWCNFLATQVKSPRKLFFFLHSNGYCNPLEITTTPPSLFRCGINLNFLRIFVKNTRFSIAFPQFTSSTAILTCGVMKSWQKGWIWLVQRQSLFSPSIANKGAGSGC